jgi:polyphenol oxidase
MPRCDRPAAAVAGDSEMTATPEALRSLSLPAPHGFFTRRGGVSAGPFASLNCSLSSPDARENVLENRARVARSLGTDPTCLVGCHQVHGADAVRVMAPWTPGNGPHADAMVTNQRGIALGIVTGDCAPVLFADIGAGVIGAAHAGWRGAVAGVLEATMAAMVALGARGGRISAAIGPCIRQHSYEVGADLREAVLRRDCADGCFFRPGRDDAHWQFDLPGYCAARLAAAGVPTPDILPFDTLSDATRFYSHRRRTLAGGGPIGHQISVVALP